MGWNTIIYGSLLAVHIGNGVHLIKISSKAVMGPQTDVLGWGFNLSIILRYLGIDERCNIKAGDYTAYNMEGQLLVNHVGYGTGFWQHIYDNYKVIIPGRFYELDGTFGSWQKEAGIAQAGTFYDATIIVAL